MDGIWIRSQNKQVLINVNGYVTYTRETRIGERKYVYEINASSREHAAHLSTYTTEERALQVLDSIQQFIACNGEMNGCKFNVFEMPAE